MAQKNIDILNMVSRQVNREFNMQIPQLVGKNLPIVSQGYQEAFANANVNTYISEMINKIAATIFAYSSVDDIFALFNKEGLVLGDTIERVFVQPTTGDDWTAPACGSSDDPYKVYCSDTIVCYLKKNFKKVYPVSIMRDVFVEGFRTFADVDRFIEENIDAPVRGARLAMRQMVLEVLTNPEIYPHTGTVVGDDIAITNAIEITGAQGEPATAKALTKAIAKASYDLTIPQAANNNAGAIRETAKSRQALVISAEWLRSIDFDFLEGVYNLDKVGIGIDKSNIVIVPSFNVIPANAGKKGYIGDKMIACIVDIDGFEKRLSLDVTYNTFNPKGLYENYFKHVQGWCGFFDMYNAIPILYNAG